MTEVSAWDPVDDNNNAAAPNGWPEGMMPSGVNNSARMMMGALRREHDRVVAQIGSTPGTITAPVINATTINATGSVTTPAVTYTGHAFGGAIAFGYDGSNTHVYVNGTDVGVIGDITSVGAGNGLAGGGTTGALSLAMSGSYSGNFSASGNLSTGVAGTVFAGAVNANTTIAAGGTVQGAHLTSTGGIDAAGSINGALIVSSGSVQGSYVTSTGSIDAATNITAGGNLSVGDQTTTRHFYASGDYASGDWKFYVTNEIWCARHLLPSADGGVGSGNAANAWAWVEAYVYYTKSDPALKRDIAPVPDRCLDLVAAIEPKTYTLAVEADEGRTHWGFLAPEVGDAMAKAGVKFDGVKTDGDMPASLVYNEMIAVLWGALREMSARVKQLEKALVK